MGGQVHEAQADTVSITDETRLLRRIPPGRTKKGELGLRPQSDCFSDPPGSTGMSVDVWEDARNPEDLLVGHDGFGVVWITVGDVRKLGLEIVRDRQPDNPYHALVQGKKTTGIKRRLAVAARWIKMPDPAD